MLLEETIQTEYFKRMGDYIRKPFFVVFLAFFSSLAAESQDMEVGFNVGGSYYLGDLNPGMHFLNSRFAYGAVARVTLDTRWAVKINASRGTIMGSASSSGFLPERGLTFTSDLTDVSGTVEFNFMPYFTGSRMNPISPYIYTGISVFFFSPVNNGISLRTMGTEGQNVGFQGRTPYGSVSVSIPMGLGVKISLAKRLGMQVYWEIHKCFNDYLDDVSTTYYLDYRNIPAGDQAGITSDPTLNHEPGMQRGNPSNKDWFSFYGVAFTYKFRLLSSKKCRDLDH
jgi:hypothetical protein